MQHHDIPVPWSWEGHHARTPFNPLPFHSSFSSSQSSTHATIFWAYIHSVHMRPTVSHQLWLFCSPAPLQYPTEDQDGFITTHKALIWGRVPAMHRGSAVSIILLVTGACFSVQSNYTLFGSSWRLWGVCIEVLTVCVCLCVPRWAYGRPWRQMQGRRTGFNTQLEINFISTGELMMGWN